MFSKNKVHYRRKSREKYGNVSKEIMSYSLNWKVSIIIKKKFDNDENESTKEKIKWDTCWKNTK